MSSKSDKELNEAFKAFDHDGNGSISRAELKEVFISLGCSHTEEEITKMLKKIDTNEDGKLSREEFKVLMENCSPADAEMCAAFNEFDKDHSGFITKDELKEAMKLMGEKLSDSEIKKMIDAADTDKDGKVGLEEFKKMMTCSQ